MKQIKAMGMGIWLCACATDPSADLGATSTDGSEAARGWPPRLSWSQVLTGRRGPVGPPLGVPVGPREEASCLTEESTPSATASLELDTIPDRATEARLVVTNTTGRDLLIGSEIRAVVGGMTKEITVPAELVRGSAATTQVAPLSSLGISAPTDLAPTAMTATMTVWETDGTFVERISTAPVSAGPSVSDALVTLTAGTRITPADLETPDPGGERATIASITLGDGGLWPSDLADPDIDGGLPHIPPNYDDGVPDAQGNYQFRFCLSWPVALDDAGFGEDYGIQPDGAWKARGARAKIESHDEVLFDGYLDLEGCTPEIDTEHRTDMWIIGYSRSRIGTNEVVSRRDSGVTEGWLRLIGDVGGSGTKYYQFGAGSLSNLQAAATFTLARVGSVSDATFTVNNRCRPDDSQCCNCASGGEIWISSPTRKFVISHEMGHRILSENTPYMNDCSVTRTLTLPCATSSSHAIDSMETTSCAAMEGFAHFVAVRTFNNHAEDDNPGAILQYWRGSGLTVDVEQGPAGGVDQYYESTCAMTPAQSAGFGVELDWTRLWWDYHTNPSPGFRPDMDLIIDEIASNSGWSPNNTYNFLLSGIESSSGVGQRDRFQEHAVWNGADH